MRRSFYRVFAHYRPEELFTLAADIESYPEFVPMCRAARVLRRDGDRLHVENQFGFAPAPLRFMTEAVFTEPHEILILSQDRLWRRFELRWRFTPEAAGCRLHCALDMEFASTFLEGVSHVAGSRLETQVMDAFERRAVRLYGRRT